jgi:3'(2'), 5'-bisphosphate nucleotidase
LPLRAGAAAFNSTPVNTLPPLPPDLMDRMLAAAIAASGIIMDVYARPFTAAEKADGSPVTIADQQAEALIRAHLDPLGIPVLGEEGVAAGDIPEFTVNIALCEDGRPTHGVVLAPATGALYWGGPAGAFAANVRDGVLNDTRPIRVAAEGPMTIVASRSHGHRALDDLCEVLGAGDDVSVGSSLKFCLLASGAARLYPRFTPTCEWDTAAGQAVVEAAGGVVLDLSGSPLTCGHADRGFLNPFFVAASGRDLAERAAREMARLTA